MSGQPLTYAEQLAWGGTFDGIDRVRAAGVLREEDESYYLQLPTKISSNGLWAITAYDRLNSTFSVRFPPPLIFVFASVSCHLLTVAWCTCGVLDLNSIR